MKKVLALVLAGMMVASLSAVAFATTVTAKVTFSGGTPESDYTSYDSGELYKANSDGKLTTVYNPKTGKNSEFKQGTTLYIPLNVNGLADKEVKKYNVKAEWSVGGDSVTGVSIQNMKKSDGSFQWFVAIASKDATGSTATQDLSGVISIYKGSNKNLPANQKAMISLGKYGYGSKNISTDLGFSLEVDTPYVVNFKDLEKDAVDIITFEGVAELEGNFYEQGKLYLGFNSKFNEEIAKAYPDANLDFTNFVGEPSLNKWAVMRLYADKEQSVYTIENDKLVKVDATYDEEYEAYRFGVKKLGTYILSDKELDVNKYVPSTPAEDTSSTPTETPDEKPAVKPNPGTGR